MGQTRPDYQSYLLRLRRADNAGWPNWWASLESTTTGEHHSFADLDGLFVFLKTQTDRTTSSAAAQAAVALVESLQAKSPQASFHLAHLLQTNWNSALQPLAIGIARRLGVDQEGIYKAIVDATQDCQQPSEGTTSTPPGDRSPIDIAKLQQAEEALRRHNRELSLLNRAMQMLSSSLDLDQVLANILEEMLYLLDVAACSVWLIESETGDLICQQAAGPGSAAMRGRRLMQREGITGRVVHTGESLLVSDTQVGPCDLTGIDRQPDLLIRSILGVPLRVEGNVIGMLQAVDDGVDRFSPSDQTLLQSLAAAAAIAIVNADLVEALRQRTLELQAQNEELDAFAHTVAHDLKSPLSLSIGFGRILAQELADTPSQAAQECIDMIVETGYKMNTIINELLLLAIVHKVEEVVLEPLDMATIVAGAENRLLSTISERRAELILPQAWPVALGHGPWVEEVWANYISNAIKYGGQPPRVELGADSPPLSSPPHPAASGPRPAHRTGAGGKEGEMVRFWVRDNGPGLAQEEQEQLFTEFTRLHRVRARGHGLGLSIVRRIVDKLGGEVGVESTPGQGSLFYFTLPAAPDSVKESQDKPKPFDLAVRLSSLPPDLLARLEQAATRTDMAAIDEHITEIRLLDEPLADKLANLAYDFAYDQILSMIRNRE